MRISDDRYTRDLRRYQLAVRMLRFEARTGTIRSWTGLSEARIRLLSKSGYALDGVSSKRHRGPAPYRVDAILQEPRLKEDAVIVAAIAALLGLQGARGSAHEPGARYRIERGEALCGLYETYVAVKTGPRLSFEQAVLVLSTLDRGVDAKLITCTNCQAIIVRDQLDAPQSTCGRCTTACVEVQVISRGAASEPEPASYQHQLF